MNCRVCDQALRKPSADQHCAEQSPFGDICIGCFKASVELELFLVRARPDRMSPMGAWAEGVLREVLADPRKFLRD